MQLLSNKMNLAIDTVIDNFVILEHRRINESMGNVVVSDNVVSKQNGVSIDFAMALTNSGDSKRSEDTELAQTMNRLDATLLCMTGVYPFTLFEKVTKLLDRCGNRLHMTGSGILRKKQEPQHGFRLMSNFLTSESSNEKKDWINGTAIYTSATFDTNFTRKQPVITTVIKLRAYVVCCFVT